MSPAPKREYVTLAGRAFSFFRVGEGEPLVCIPGGPGLSGDYLLPLAALLNAQLIILDPRGTGESYTPQRYSTEGYVRDIELFRRALGLKKMNLIGHSHGGLVVAAYAAKHPDRLKRLVLLNALSRITPKWIETVEAWMESCRGYEWFEAAEAGMKLEETAATDDEYVRAASEILPFYFSKWDDTGRAYMEEGLKAKTRGSVKATRSFGRQGGDDVTDRLDRITAPTLIVTGDDDFVCGPLCGDDFRDGITGAQYEIAEHGGHFLFIERPDWLSRVVNEFLLGA